MPRPRKILLCQPSEKTDQFFHCVSRVVNREFVFEIAEREKFAEILRAVEIFSGIRVMTWTILSNHFHVLLEIPAKPKNFNLSEQEFWRRIEALYTGEEVAEIRATFRSFHQETGGAAGEVMARDYRQRFLDRMLDLSEVMKTLKQRFTMWFNRSHDRVGTLWESRFKSVLVEGDAVTLSKVAAYVDLNAVRAGLVSDPIDYRWCGYAEALGASSVDIRERARNALTAVISRDTIDNENDDDWSASSKTSVMVWNQALKEYRKLIFGIGDESFSKKGGFTEEEVRAVWAAGGNLTEAQLLRCRVRFFTDGLVIGSKAFVEDYFGSTREAFGRNRKTGARKIRGAETGLYAFRDLRKNAISAV